MKSPSVNNDLAKADNCIRIASSVMMPWLVVLIGYFLGSVPTAYIAGRLLQDKDIRKLGDGNVGSANAFRYLGARVGVLVGIIDAAKGTSAILIALAASVSQPWVLAAGAAAVAGHNWPFFLGFRGGRGVATTTGVLYTVMAQPMLIITIPAFVTLIILHDVTKTAAIATFLLLLVCWWMGTPGILIGYSIALLCLVGFTHLLRTRMVRTSDTGSS